jgi:1,2-diacylglycerol 3-alpha-glucosyltransferase
MKICIIFFNIGGYHVARLEATRRACEGRGWSLSAIQVAGNTTEHPWGDISLSNYVITLKSRHVGSDFSLGDSSPLLDALDSVDPDAVAIPGWGFDFARAALAWVRKRGRIAILMSESKEDDSPRVWWKELAKRLFSVRHFHSAIVGGSKHRAYLRRLGMMEERIFYGYDIVDNGYFIDSVDAIRNRQNPLDIPTCVRERRYFLAVNRFIPRKNLAALVIAFSEFLKGSEVADAWDLVLLGDGLQKDELVQLVSRLDLQNRIHFPGFQTYSQISHWYSFANVFIHPALSEQWGLVVNEAMAAGLPVVLSQRCGCYPELMVEHETGISFDPESHQQLTAAMIRLSENDSLRAFMGQNSRTLIVDKFGPDRFADGLMACVNASGIGRQAEVTE